MEEVIKLRKKQYSEEEKRGFCEAFKGSGLTQVLFCQEAGISKSALGNWLKQFDPSGGDSFFSMQLKEQDYPGVNLIEVKIRLSNQLELLVPIKEVSLIPFIREICDATSTLR